MQLHGGQRAKPNLTDDPEAAWQRAQLEAVSSRPMAARGGGVPQSYPPLPNDLAQRLPKAVRWSDGLGIIASAVD